MNRKAVIPAFVIGVMAISGAVYATGASASWGKSQNINSELAEKLGVEESKVTAAMDELHTERQADMQAEYEANLNEAVSDGKISAEQKQAILDKRAELEVERAARQTENEKWMADNGLDQDSLAEYGIGIGQGFAGKGGHRGYNN